MTSVRWELMRQGLEDVEYLAMLDRLAGEADGLALAAQRPATACCAGLAAAKAALDAVDEVTWGITSSGTGPQPGNPPYNLTESEPYTAEPAVLHRVLDGVAAAIEGVRLRCAVG